MRAVRCPPGRAAKSTFLVLLVGLSVLANACGSPQARGSAARPGGTGDDTARPQGPKSLTIAVESEPQNLVFQMAGASGSRGGTQFHPVVHQRLASYDNAGEAHPRLATELPSREGGTWIIRADGTMETRYRLRPNVTWHDGTPLSAKDFVFGRTVILDPEIPTQQRSVAQRTAAIDTPDDLTLVIQWASLYPFANAIVEEEFGPLPSHLLETTYTADKGQFINSRYWTREFVGVGPYQLAEWEPGSHLVLTPYDRFYGGRAPIDRLVFRFIEDDATVVANLLAGAVDGAIPRALPFNEALFVSREWEASGRKSNLLLLEATHWRTALVQFRDPRPREMLDVRVRQGLLHALDRNAVVETLYAGQAPVSHTFVPPADPKWSWVQDVAARYDYDPRRAQQLLAAVGWRLQDGVIRDALGSPVVIPAWSTSGENNARELAIIADYWKAAGLSVEQTILSAAQARDFRLRVSFTGVFTTEIPLDFSQTLGRAYGPVCPTEQSGWVGSNRGCYQNPQMDRVIDALHTAIDPADQRLLYRELVKIQTEDLPVLPLQFEIQATLFREGVSGVKGDTRPTKTSVLWNINEWDLR